jgi:hypothetical protein
VIGIWCRKLQWKENVDIFGKIILKSLYDKYFVFVTELPWIYVQIIAALHNTILLIP